MSEYQPFKKLKNYWVGKNSAKSPQSHPAPVLDAANEDFLKQVIDTESTPPILPTGTQNPDPATDDNIDDEAAEKSKYKSEVETGKRKIKATWFMSKPRSIMKKRSGSHADPTNVSADGAIREEDELSRVLEDLSLSANNNRAFPISHELGEILQKFSVVLKDIINGVPTAYDDLVNLLENSHSTLNNSYENLPDFLKKMTTQLLEKMKSTMASKQATNSAGFPGIYRKGAALAGISFWESLVKPQAIITLLREILMFLRLRWPTFMATNVLLSIALSMLLFILWYCHKRGKEQRLEREAKMNSTGQEVELKEDDEIEATNDKAYE